MILIVMHLFRIPVLFSMDDLGSRRRRHPPRGAKRGRPRGSRRGGGSGSLGRQETVLNTSGMNTQFQALSNFSGN